MEGDVEMAARKSDQTRGRDASMNNGHGNVHGADIIPSLHRMLNHFLVLHVAIYTDVLKCKHSPCHTFDAGMVLCHPHAHFHDHYSCSHPYLLFGHFFALPSLHNLPFFEIFLLLVWVLFPTLTFSET